MENEWQYPRGQQQEMSESPSHANVRRYPPPQQQQQQGQSAAAPAQYTALYTSPTRPAASPTSRHSITADFSGINIRDEAVSDKSPRPNLSLYQGNARGTQG